MGEVKDNSQTVFPNIEQSIRSINYGVSDYLIFLKVSDEFDEYYDIHGIDEVNINSKYYELFQSIPDINIS